MPYKDSFSEPECCKKMMREFRCLINPNKNKPEYDNKILSIPFYDICLNKDRVGTTTQGQEEIGIKGGDVFTWKETNTKWLLVKQ